MVDRTSRAAQRDNTSARRAGAGGAEADDAPSNIQTMMRSGGNQAMVQLSEDGEGESTEQGSAGTGAGPGAAISPERDERLAEVEAVRRALLEQMTTRDLIRLANEINPGVMGGEGLGPISRASRAETLVRIYEILEDRAASAPLGADGTSEPDPRNPGRLEDDRLPAGADDPLGGLVDAIAPFGNLDAWRGIMADGPRPAPPRRARRARPQRRRPERETQPEPAATEAPSPEGAPPPGPNLDSDVVAEGTAPDTSVPRPGPETGARTLAGFAIGQVINAVTAPLAGGVMTLAALVGNFGSASDRSRAQGRAAGRSFGVRYGTHALTQWSPPPPQYAYGEVLQRVRDTEGGAPYRAQVAMSFTPMSPGMMAGWIHGAVGQLVGDVNGAFRRGDQQIAQHLAANPSAAAQVAGWKREMREGVIERLRAQVASVAND